MLIYPFLRAQRRLVKLFAYRTQNIAVILLHKIGDTVFTIPAVKQLQKKYRGMNLYLVGFDEGIGIYKEYFGDFIYNMIDKLNF